jgi:hypothetical protein
MLRNTIQLLHEESRDEVARLFKWQNYASGYDRMSQLAAS